MKIVFLADSISTQKAGIHYYGLQLIKQLVNAYPEYNFSLIASSEIKGINIDQHIIPINPLIKLHLRLRQFIHIPSLVRKLKPDMVVELAHFGPFNIPKSIARVTVIHDLTPITHPHFHSRSSQLAHKILIPGILKRAKYIIVNSYTTKETVHNYYGKPLSSIKVIYPDLSDLRNSENFVPNPDSHYFLSVGTIEPRKNYLAIIKAFEIFARENKDHTLKIVGKPGWKYNTLFQYVQNSSFKNRIEFMGYVSRGELKKLFAHTSGYISASYIEGFGMPIGEALSNSLPIIASDIAATREIAGTAPLYFRPSDHETLARKMEELTNSKVLSDRLGKSSLMQFKKLMIMNNDLDFLKT